MAYRNGIVGLVEDARFRQCTEGFVAKARGLHLAVVIALVTITLACADACTPHHSLAFLPRDADVDAPVVTNEVETGGSTGLGGISGSGGLGGQATGGVQASGGSGGATLDGTSVRVPSDASAQDLLAAKDGLPETSLCPDADNQQPTKITVGGFDVSRGGQCGLAAGSFLLQLRAQLVSAKFPGIDFVLTGSATLSPSYLATVDILIVTSTASNTSAITPLSLAEQEAVGAFILRGGRFLISSDNSTFGGATTEVANDSLLAPVQMTAGGMTLSGKHAMESVGLPSPLVSGRFGTWATIDTNYPGTWKSTGPATVVAYVRGDPAMPALAQLDDGALAPGSGRGVVIADMNAMVDYQGPNTVMLDNVLDYLIAGLRKSDCPEATAKH